MSCLPPSTSQRLTEDWDDGDFIINDNEQPIQVPPSRHTSYASSSQTPTHQQSARFNGWAHKGRDDPFEEEGEDDLAGWGEDDDDERGGTLKLKRGDGVGLGSVPLPMAMNGGRQPGAGGKAGFISLEGMKAFQAKSPGGVNSVASGSVSRLGGKALQGKMNGFDEDDDFEQDLDFPIGTIKMPLKRDQAGSGAGPVMNKPKPFALERPTSWDDFDMMDEDDEREATLKAGAVTLKDIKSHLQGRTAQELEKERERERLKRQEEEELEADFAIPLTMARLKLATRTEYPSSTHTLRHRSSRSSILSSSNTSGSGWDLPDGTRSRSSFASPSASSASIASSAMPLTDHSEADLGRSVTVADDEDFEQDLVLPTPSFFSTGRAQELNSLLDRKRKNQPGHEHAGGHSHPRHSGGGGGDSGTFKASSSRLMKPTISSAAKVRHDSMEEAFEDGLILEEEGAELNQGRLSRLRKARAPPPTPPTSGRVMGGGTIRRGTVPRQRIDSGNFNRDRPTSTFKVESPESKLKKPESTRIPSEILAATPATTPHRLRAQKSHARLTANNPASPTPLMTRKQSLASLRDAMAQQDYGHQPSYIAPTAASAAKQASKSRERFGEAAQQPLPPMRPRTPSDQLVNPAQQTPQRQTVPLSASKPKSRPALGSTFVRPSSSASNPPGHINNSHLTSMMPIAQVLKRPKIGKMYGDGTELDDFDDLQLDRQKEGMVKVPKGSSGSGWTQGLDTGRTTIGYNTAGVSGLPNSAHLSGMGIGLGRPSGSDASSTIRLKPTSSSISTGEKRKKTGLTEPKASGTPLKKGSKKAGLIRHLGKVEKKQVGEMTWNPQTLRWEGNYSVLRDFDNQLSASVRPALIAYHAPSGPPQPGSPEEKASYHAAQHIPAGGYSSQALRVVGNMMFDPEKMCWISTLPVGEEEADPFEGMADDEGDDATSSGWKGDKSSSISGGMSASCGSSQGRLSGSAASEMEDEFGDAVGGLHGKIDLKLGRGLFSVGGPVSRQMDRNMSINSSVYSLAGSVVPGHRLPQPYTSGYNTNWTWIDRDLYEETIAADARHREEMKAWFGGNGGGSASASGVEKSKERKEKDEDRERRREEKRLWEIRHLVMDR